MWRSFRVGADDYIVARLNLMRLLALAVHARPGAQGDWRLDSSTCRPCGVYPVEQTIACVAVPKGQSLLSESCNFRAGRDSSCLLLRPKLLVLRSSECLSHTALNLCIHGIC